MVKLLGRLGSWTGYFTKVKEPNLPYYLPIAGGRIFEFIPFLRVLTLCKMQTDSSRIRTRVAESISYVTGYLHI